MEAKVNQKQQCRLCGEEPKRCRCFYSQENQEPTSFVDPSQNFCGSENVAEIFNSPRNFGC